MQSSKMKSFSWKKTKSQISKRKLEAIFNEDSDDDAEIDWLTSIKKPKSAALFLEDSKAKTERLKKEGITLADDGKWWQAISVWNNAITYSDDPHIHEMLAQAYMQVLEVFLAIQSAENAVKIDPKWWEAYQTLGRAQMGYGNIAMAIKSFSKAVHIYPASEELWKEDLLDKPAFIPDKRKEREFPEPPEFVRNVMGSSAGAGSGEFHVYRHIRRREYARQEFLQRKKRRELLDEEYHEKIVQNKYKSEVKTAKKRAKRQKRKEKMKMKKMQGKNLSKKESSSESEELSDDNEDYNENTVFSADANKEESISHEISNNEKTENLVDNEASTNLNTENANG